MMINVGKESDLGPQMVIAEAVNFFGPEGAGLKVALRGEDFARFVGNGGYIYVQACPKGDGSEVDLEGRAWIDQIELFLTEI